MSKKTQLTFGKRDEKHKRNEWIYARYACGDSVKDIARDAGITPKRVYEIMKSCPENYEETKARREQYCGLRLMRALSLIDSQILRFVEDASQKEFEELDPRTQRELRLLIGDLSHRVQLHEGKATQIIQSQFSDSITLDEAEKRIADAKAAGMGLDDRSVNNGNGHANGERQAE